MKITSPTIQFAGRKRPPSEESRLAFLSRRKPVEEKPENMLANYDLDKDPFREQLHQIEQDLSANWNFYNRKSPSQNTETMVKESILFLQNRFKNDPLLQEAWEALKAFTRQETWQAAKPYYRKLARLCHPDVSPTPDAKVLIVHVNRLKGQNK